MIISHNDYFMGKEVRQLHRSENTQEQMGHTLISVIWLRNKRFDEFLLI